MLTQGRFLISYQIFDNIQVNNIGQTHVREILKDTQAFTINYRTEQIRDYLRYPRDKPIPTGYTSEPRRSSIPLPTPQKINKKNT